MSLVQFFAQNSGQVTQLTLEHLWMVGVSTVLAALIGIPLGILIAHRPLLNRPVLGAANIIQTIPSLALFGFLLPVPWLGDRAERLAILALTLYALLPVIRGTYTGIRGVDRAVGERAAGGRHRVVQRAVDDGGRQRDADADGRRPRGLGHGDRRGHGHGLVGHPRGEP